MKKLVKAIMIHVERVMNEYQVTMEQAEELVYQALMSNIIAREIDSQIEFLADKAGIEKKPTEKLKHKNITLTEMKTLFSKEYKTDLTKKKLKTFLEYGYEQLIMDDIEVDLSATRKRTQIFAKFIKGGYIYHMAC